MQYTLFTRHNISAMFAYSPDGSTYYYCYTGSTTLYYTNHVLHTGCDFPTSLPNIEISQPITSLAQLVSKIQSLKLLITL
jgi:hypothetical protein